MFLCAVIISFDRIRLWAETTILRILLLKILLLRWVESTTAEFNSDAVFSEVGRTTCLHGPKRLGQTIHQHRPNTSWAKPSGTRFIPMAILAV